MPEGSYFGGKGASGVAQNLINEIPRHDVFVSAFLGYCRIRQMMRPAAVSHGIELDPDTLAAWNDHKIPGLQLHQADGIEWLRHYFSLTAWPAPRPLLPAEQLRAALAGGQVPFVFADPPYPHSTRRGDRYRFEMDDAGHLRLLDVLVRVPAMVMVVSYPNPMYEEALRGWRTFRYQNQTRGGIRTEQAWCNYGEPDALHDSRFIGRNKRERERVARRRRNWRSSIDRMGPHERQALLDELRGAQEARGGVPRFDLLWKNGQPYCWSCRSCGRVANSLDNPICPGCLRDARPSAGTLLSAERS